jgi:hypothetical protein
VADEHVVELLGQQARDELALGRAQLGSRPVQALGLLGGQADVERLLGDIRTIST